MRGSVLAFVALLSTGCGSEPQASLNANEAIRLANTDFADALPQVPLNLMTVEAHDAGNQWRVIYRPPEGWMGPDFLGPIVIDKRTGAVVQSMKGPNYVEAD